MSAADRVSRMLALVPWLLARPGVTIDEAADAFGVDRATLSDDLSKLDFCGLPGLRGGDLFEVHLDGDRITLLMADELRRPLRLTPGESLRLVLALEAVAQAFADELPALRSAVDKVRAHAQLPPAVTVSLGDTGGWHGVLRQAVIDGRRVALDYQGRSDAEPRHRVVDPWALQVRRGTWYLAAHDDEAGARRTFRLDRIAMVEVLDEPVGTPPPSGALAPPVYERHDGDIEVVIEVTPQGRWLATAIEADRVEELGAGAARLTFWTDAPSWVAGLVLTASGDARVVAPSSLRDDVCKAAAAALATLDA